MDQRASRAIRPRTWKLRFRWVYVSEGDSLEFWGKAGLAVLSEKKQTKGEIVPFSKLQGNQKKFLIFFYKSKK